MRLVIVESLYPIETSVKKLTGLHLDLPNIVLANQA